jgi:hypothetical protein
LPTSGPVGSQVAIEGTNFGTTSGNVTFNGANATIKIWSNTLIVVATPSGVQSGNVVVSTGSQTSNGVAFTVVTPSGTTPVITWAAPTAITYGTTLNATQLDATANVAGTFAYSPVAGTLLPAGNQVLFVMFTPTNTSTYTTTTASVPLTVNQATTTISLTASPTGTITYGTAVTIAAAIASSTATGTVTFNTGSTALGSATLANGSAALTVNTLPVGSNTITAAYSGDANHSASSASLQTPISVTTATVYIVPVTPPTCSTGAQRPRCRRHTTSNSRTEPLFCQAVTVGCPPWL